MPTEPTDTGADSVTVLPVMVAEPDLKILAFGDVIETVPVAEVAVTSAPKVMLSPTRLEVDLIVTLVPDTLPEVLIAPA